MKIEISITTNGAATYFYINHPARFAYFIYNGEIYVNDFNYKNVKIQNDFSRRVLIKKIGTLLNLWEQRNKFFQEELMKLI